MHHVTLRVDYEMYHVTLSGKHPHGSMLMKVKHIYRSKSTALFKLFQQGYYSGFICCSVGYMLGLGLAVSALCNDSQTEARAHVLSVIDKLQSLLESQSLEHQVRMSRIR